MAEDKYIEAIFPIKCYGRQAGGEKVLKEPVLAKVSIYQSPGDEEHISTLVKCPYNYGSHGGNCKASHPDEDRKIVKVMCPYSFDIPYCFDEFEWSVRANEKVSISKLDEERVPCPTCGANPQTGRCPISCDD